MAEYSTPYQALDSCDDDDTDDNDLTINEQNVMIHVVPENSIARWNHIENLDEFFNRIYQYHQRHGFLCMVVEDVLQLIQFVFVVVFSTFLMKCVNYDVLFANVHYNETHKVTIPEAVLPMDQCMNGFDFSIIMCLTLATAFWLFRLLKVIYLTFKYLEIRSFFISGLKISSNDLPNMTWHEVQRRLLEVQKEQHLCIHKQELNELDIYHRILRFKNYMIAMVNKSVVPVKFKLPFIGNYVFLSTGLKYNFDFILFWGPWSPFANNWHLHHDYKDGHQRKQLAESLSSKILWLGIANFAFAPLILVWQILYLFFRYGELIKRQPSALGARRWSNYARLNLRHFNELDHEFNARLNSGYAPASYYMNIFTTPLLIIIAKNVAFFSGSILAVLLVLTVVDEDVLSVEHILTTMTIAGLIVTVCKGIIPDENVIYCPERTMKSILSHIHYMPDSWNGHAHTTQVRDEFALLFQYKAVYLLEELISPIITPFVLCFSLRAKSLEIVDFLRNFSVEVVGVGDVCSFAQMDIRKHGNAQWATNTESNKAQQAEDGKTELSLMHFHLTNPEWRPPEMCSIFIQTIKEQAQTELLSLNTMQHENPTISSFYSPVPSLGVGVGYGYSSMVSSFANQSLATISQPGTVGVIPPLRGAVANISGPIITSSGAVVGSMHGSLDMSTSQVDHCSRRFDEGTLELMTADMSISALYMHEKRHRRCFEDEHVHSANSRLDSTSHTPSMPEIVEKSQEEDCSERELDTSDLRDKTKTV